MRLKIIGFAVAMLVLSVAFVAPVGAQATDFGAILTSTQALSNQLDTALAQPNDATTQAAVTQALAMAQTLSSDLKAIQASATDDATRSRASGLAAHIDAAIGSLTSAQTATGDQLRSQINAAKAEVTEGISEIPAGGAPQQQPQQPQQPQQVPTTGEPGFITGSIGLLALIGFSLMLVGLSLRRLQPVRR